MDAFDHLAFYNEVRGRIEMHLVSRTEQQVTVDDTIISFDKGESIHTENSYKYSIEEFQTLATQAGFTPQRVWTDADNLFSLHYFTAS